MDQEGAKRPRQANPRRPVKAPSPPAGARVPGKPRQAQSVLPPEIQATNDLADLRDAYRAAQEKNKAAQAELKARDKRIRDLSDELVRLVNTDREAEQRRAEQAILRTKTLVRKRRDAVASLEAQLAWYEEEEGEKVVAPEGGEAGEDRDGGEVGEADLVGQADKADQADQADQADSTDPADPVAIEFEDPSAPAASSAAPATPAAASHSRLLKAAKAYLLARARESYLSSHAASLESTLRTDTAYLEANLEERRKELASQQAAARDLRRKRDMNIENIQALTDELAANGVSIAELEEAFAEMSAESLRRRQLEIAEGQSRGGVAGRRVDIDQMLELVRSRVSAEAEAEEAARAAQAAEAAEAAGDANVEDPDCFSAPGELGPENGSDLSAESNGEPSEDVDARIVATLSRTGERIRLGASPAQGNVDGGKDGSSGNSGNLDEAYTPRSYVLIA